MEGWQIQNEAFKAFDVWLSGQSDEIQEMNVLEQVDLYAAFWTTAAPTKVGAA